MVDHNGETDYRTARSIEQPGHWWSSWAVDAVAAIAVGLTMIGTLQSEPEAGDRAIDAGAALLASVSR